MRIDPEEVTDNVLQACRAEDQQLRVKMLKHVSTSLAQAAREGWWNGLRFGLLVGTVAGLIVGAAVAAWSAT